MKISFEELALLITVSAFLVVGLLFFVQRSREASYRRKLHHQIVYCPVCGSLFEERTTEKLPACQSCGRKTLRGDDRSLG